MAVATNYAVASVARKKTAGAKKPKLASSHPPFFEMISDAILSLKEKTGSSQYAITKFIEEKHKQLPSNFRKLLLVQVKKFVASGKLVKVKASFKLPPSSAAVKPKAASSAAAKSKPKPAKAASKPKAKVATPVKRKAKIAVKQISTPKAKAKPAAKPTKVAKTTKSSSPGKKVKAPAKKKAVVTKKPKSVKSPAKKTAPKKAKK
ncbi:hypothetical protein CRYUN_Cryun16bG0021400 [Craigia yunnanensis]